MDDRFGFVILNYRTMDETMDCVKSIDEHIREAHEIVIVDNASPDGSGEKLRQVYDGRGDIKVLINADNLGYACGNNAGIKQARLDGCRYVVVLNSDTKVMQDEFCDIVRQEYRANGYAVIGPQIYKHGIPCCDNPGRDRAMSRLKLHIFIFMNRVFLALSYVALDAVLTARRCRMWRRWHYMAAVLYLHRYISSILAGLTIELICIWKRMFCIITC